MAPDAVGRLNALEWTIRAVQQHQQRAKIDFIASLVRHFGHGGELRGSEAERPLCGGCDRVAVCGGACALPEFDCPDGPHVSGEGVRLDRTGRELDDE